MAEEIAKTADKWSIEQFGVGCVFSRNGKTYLITEQTPTHYHSHLIPLVYDVVTEEEVLKGKWCRASHPVSFTAVEIQTKTKKTYTISCWSCPTTWSSDVPDHGNYLCLACSKRIRLAKEAEVLLGRCDTIGKKHKRWGKFKHIG